MEHALHYNIKTYTVRLLVKVILNKCWISVWSLLPSFLKSFCIELHNFRIGERNAAFRKLNKFIQSCLILTDVDCVDVVYIIFITVNVFEGCWLDNTEWCPHLSKFTLSAHQNLLQLTLLFLLDSVVTSNAKKLKHLKIHRQLYRFQ